MRSYRWAFIFSVSCLTLWLGLVELARSCIDGPCESYLPSPASFFGLSLISMSAVAGVISFFLLPSGFAGSRAPAEAKRP